MSVTFYIPGPLRAFTDGRSRVDLAETPATLREALESLWTLCPEARDRVANEQGHIREHINLFVGDEDIRYTGGLDTVIPAGAEISIIPAVSGG